MPNKKISQFDEGVLLIGTEYVPLVQPVIGTKGNKRFTVDEIAARAKGQGNSLWIDCGDYDASTTVFPTSGSADDGGVDRFNTFLVTVGGVIAGVYVPEGAILIAFQNDPTDDWTITGWKQI